VPFPLYEGFLKIHHCVHDEFHETAIKNAAFFPDVVIVEEIPYLPLTVGAWSTHIFLNIWRDDILKNLKDLLEFNPPRDCAPPVGKVHGLHNSEPATAAAAVILHSVGFHLLELGADLPQYLSFFVGPLPDFLFPGS